MSGERPERKDAGAENGRNAEATPARKPGRRARTFSVSDMERVTFTMSVAMVLIGLICLPHVEKGGSSWHVLMLVFGINAVLLVWIVLRILSRRRKG